MLVAPIALFAQVKNQNLPENVQDSLINTSFLLKNNEVIFSKVFVSDLNKAALLEKLQSILPNIGNFEFKIDASNSDKINGVLTGTTVNYRKYGGTLMGTNRIMNYPLYGNVVVQVKDFKYRVLITNLSYKNVPEPLGYGKMDFILDDGVTRNKRTKFKSSIAVHNILTYIDMHFTDLFNINAKQAVDTF